MALEIVPGSEPQERHPNGNWGSGGTSANVEGLNQYSPQVRARRRIALAIDRRLAKHPECAQKVAEQVEAALLDLNGDGNLDIVKAFLPAETRLGVEFNGGTLPGPADSSRSLLDGLASDFGGAVPEDARLVGEGPAVEARPDQGTD